MHSAEFYSIKICDIISQTKFSNFNCRLFQKGNLNLHTNDKVK